jgi:hypothetical protein
MARVEDVLKAARLAFDEERDVGDAGEWPWEQVKHSHKMLVYSSKEPDEYLNTFRCLSTCHLQLE